MVRLIGLALGVRIEKTVHFSLVTFHDAVLWPAWTRGGGGGTGGGGERVRNV